MTYAANPWKSKEEKLYAAEQKILSMPSSFVASFDPTAPSGISLVDHIQSLPVLIVDLQMAIYNCSGMYPNVLEAGHMAWVYLQDGPTFSQLPPANKVTLPLVTSGTLYRKMEAHYADHVSPGEIWLYFKRKYYIDGEVIEGTPVATLSIIGYEEHPLKKLARQAE